jgi:transcriptional regulator with XRE-family HTH domain
MRTVTSDGTHIRSLREAKGWTQEEFAEATKYSVRTIQRIEASEDLPIYTLKRIADVLGVDLQAMTQQGIPYNDKSVKRLQLIESSEKLATVVVVLPNAELKNYLPEAFQQAIQIAQEMLPSERIIYIVGVEPGDSIRITLKMIAEDRHRFRSGFTSLKKKAGKLLRERLVITNAYARVYSKLNLFDEWHNDLRTRFETIGTNILWEALQILWTMTWAEVEEPGRE